MAVGDFLFGIGYQDATVRGVACVVQAIDIEGNLIHSLGVGTPGQPSLEDKFNGHVVVTVPQLNLLVETTLYSWDHSWDRPAWNGALFKMIALEYHPPDAHRLFGLHPIAGFGIFATERILKAVWL